MSDENKYEKDSVIEDIMGFFNIIHDLNEKASEEGPNGQVYFFRGQSNVSWSVTPSVFRNDLVNNEHSLISNAYNRKPVEFQGISTDFEKLTKLQHYGLPTRLLDVTTNPLVALYFACEESYDETSTSEDSYKREEADGCIYFKKDYGRGYNESEIAIISFLAGVEIKSDFLINDCLKMLESKGLYKRFGTKTFIRKDYDYIIKLLQNNYFVTSTMNNDRLIRQSGAFLLPSCFNFVNDVESGNIKIQKATGNLTKEFDEQRIVIPSGCKGTIREELNLYNINEATLFPELEHQLSYIKTFQESRNNSKASSFEVFDYGYNTSTKEEAFISDDVVKKSVSAARKVLRNSEISDKLKDDCIKIVRSQASIDWYKKESNVNKMISSISRVLIKEFGSSDAKEISNEIITEIRENLLKGE